MSKSQEQDLSRKCSAWKDFGPFSLTDRVKCGVQCGEVGSVKNHSFKISKLIKA